MKTITLKARYSENAQKLFEHRDSARIAFKHIINIREGRTTQDVRERVDGFVISTEPKKKKAAK